MSFLGRCREADLETAPLPACARKATELLGRDGELVVLPKTGRGIMAKVARFGFRPPVVANILATGQAVITGSFLLHHLMVGAKWVCGDLDIFGTQHALDVAKFWLWKPHKEVIASDYDVDPNIDDICTWTSDAQISRIVEWTSDVGTKLKFVCVDGDLAETIRGFDLAFTRLWFDGVFTYVPRATHEALQRRACALDMTPSVYREHVIFVCKFFERALKYAERGFAIRLPRHITVESLYEWDRLVAQTHLFSDQPAVRTLLQWAYLMPKAQRRAALQARITRRYAAPSATAPTCTAVRRKGRTWLTRARVLAWAARPCPQECLQAQ